MHGFRPGKVPIKVVEQPYGPQVRQEVLGETRAKIVRRSRAQAEPQGRGLPALRARRLLEQGANEFEFSATFEVYPEVHIGDIAGVDDHTATARGE